MTATRPDPYVDLMRPAQVARTFGVHPRTVLRWAKAGRLSSVRTEGGHRRYRRDEVARLVKPSDGVR